MNSGCRRGWAGARFGSLFYEVNDQMLMAAGGLISKVTSGLSASLGDNLERGQ